MSKELPFSLRTGEVAPNKSRIGFDSLLKLDRVADGEAARIALAKEGVSAIFKETSGGIPLNEDLLRMIGSDYIKRWELIYCSIAPSMLIIGGEKPEEGRLELDDATATIFLNRHVHAGTNNKVVFYSARFADIIPDTKTILEFSYGDPDISKSRKKEIPFSFRLSHIGFSVSPKELPEDPSQLLSGSGIYVGHGIKNTSNGQTIYTPCYETFPMDREIDILFDNELDFYSGSVITERMRKRTGEDKRMLRTEYNEWARKPEHVIYLGGERENSHDPAGASGFYSHADEEQVWFGRNIQDLREGISWRVSLPQFLKR